MMKPAKRAFSGAKPMPDLPKIKCDETAEKPRPGSGQPPPIMKSPLPPRKQMHQSQEKPKNQIRTNPSQIDISREDSLTKLTQSHILKVQLPLVKSPIKSAAKKPPLQLNIQEKKPVLKQVIPKQKYRVSSAQRIRMMEKSLQNNISPVFQKQDQFHWPERLNLVITPTDLQPKRNRRQQSHDSKPMDFTMTTKKDEIAKILALYRQELEEAARISHQNANLNMSEIQEQSEDGLSSLAQSGLENQSSQQTPRTDNSMGSFTKDLELIQIEDFVNAQELINSPKPNSLEEYLAEFESFQSLGKQPFTLRIANRDIAYNDNRELAPQQIVMVFLADYLKITQSLKLQRCKEQQLQSQDSKNQTKQIKKGDYHLDDCLRGFIKEEILGKGDEWYCNKCKQHVQATKKMEIYRAPKILIIHLKRFKTNRIHNFGNYYFSGNSQKISTVVHYPLELSLNNFVLSKGYGDSIDYTYDLFGVDNHYGGLGGGHYTAYAFNPIYQKWVDFNDSTARMSSNDVISDAGYVLFYRRRDAPTCKLGK